jgi:hypothetical protein
MERLIRVELTDGAICRMAQKALDLFLAQDKVVKFERSDGWVVVGRDPLRDITMGTEYVEKVSHLILQMNMKGCAN